MPVCVLLSNIEPGPAELRGLRSGTIGHTFSIEVLETLLGGAPDPSLGAMRSSQSQLLQGRAAIVAAAGADAPLSHSIQPPAGVHAGTQTRHTRCALSEGQPQQGGTSGGDSDPTRNDHWGCGLGSTAANSTGVSARCAHTRGFLKRILQWGLGAQGGAVQGRTAVYQRMTLAPG